MILLDEPTTGLDPQARHLIWDRLYRLKQRGATLLLTTHYMDEAEQLCDRLVIMDKARIVAEGSPRQLIEQHSTREVLELRVPDDERVAPARPARRPGRPDRGASRPRALTPPTASARSSRCTRAAIRSRARWCGAPRWRMSSSASPAARSSSEARAMIGALRIVQRNALVYRRVWRGSLFMSFLQPTLFLLAMGVGSGRARRCRRVGRCRAAWRFSSSSRRACWPPRACRRRRSSRAYPISGKMTLAPQLRGHHRRRRCGSSDLVLGELAVDCGAPARRWPWRSRP